LTPFALVGGFLGPRALLAFAAEPWNSRVWNITQGVEYLIDHTNVFASSTGFGKPLYERACVLSIFCDSFRGLYCRYHPNIHFRSNTWDRHCTDLQDLIKSVEKNRTANLGYRWQGHEDIVDQLVQDRYVTYALARMILITIWVGVRSYIYPTRDT